MPIPTYRELLSTHSRGGFPWTRLVSQRLGAVFARAALRTGTSATRVTVASLVVSLATSVAAALLVAQDHRGLAGLIAFVGWQVAYGLDCADGQVARATGTTSVSGARLDVTADFAGRTGLVAALAPSAVAAGCPAFLVVAAGAGWLFSLFDEVSGRDGDAATAAIDHGSRLYRLTGHIRDGGAQMALAAIGLGISPWGAAAALVGIGGLWLVVLAARLAVLVARGERASPPS